MIGLREEFSGIHIQSFYKNYHLPQFNLTEKLGDGCEIIIPDFIIQEDRVFKSRVFRQKVKIFFHFLGFWTVSKPKFLTCSINFY